MWHHMGEYGWGWGGMWLGMLLFWGVLGVAVAVLLLKSTKGHSDDDGRKREKSALEVLKERYARGEIGREEFQEKKHDLES